MTPVHKNIVLITCVLSLEQIAYLGLLKNLVTGISSHFQKW